MIVDAGKFDWNSDKFQDCPSLCDSYHGINFAKDVGAVELISPVSAPIWLPRDTGEPLSPNSTSFPYSFKGLETLSLRVERHTENALKVVEF